MGMAQVGRTTVGQAPTKRGRSAQGRVRALEHLIDRCGRESLSTRTIRRPKNISTTLSRPMARMSSRNEQ